MNQISTFHKGRTHYFSVSRVLLFLILLALAIAPAFALGEGNRNLFLIGVMLLSPAVILFIPFQLFKSDIWLLLFMFSIIVFPLVHQPEYMRWSTVLYSCMFCLTFMAYNRLLHFETFDVYDYQRLLKLLILAYFVVLLIQQFCVLTGLPVFNLSNYNPNDPWKLNALSAEPSHSARIVALLMYCYITVREITMERGYELGYDLKTDRWVWIAFIWTMLTMGSATAFLFIAVVLMKFVRLRNLIPLVGIMIVIILLANWLGIEAYERTWRTFMATLTLDEQEILRADHSAAVRIIPVIESIRMIDPTTLNGWFGNGIDHTASIMYTIMPGLKEGASGGGIAAFAVDYGFVSTVLFLMFSGFAAINRKEPVTAIFWILLVLMNSLNTQITWLAIIFLYTVNYFKKEKWSEIKK